MMARPIQLAVRPANASAKKTKSRSRLARQNRTKKSAAIALDIARTPHMKVLMSALLSRFPGETEYENQHSGDGGGVAIPEKVDLRRQDNEVEVEDHIVDGEEDEAKTRPEEKARAIGAITAEEQHRAQDAGECAQDVNRFSHDPYPSCARRTRRRTCAALRSAIARWHWRSSAG